MLPPAYDRDLSKAICETCGAQYPQDVSSPPSGCKICLDPRQWVPPTGQKWTSIKQLLAEEVKTTFLHHELDDRIIRVTNDPPVAIAQTPIILHTPAGVLIWDSTGYISPDGIQKICARFTPDAPFLGIAISHPHFYNSAATIFQALTEAVDPNHVASTAKIFVSAIDREWWMRADEQGLEHVDFWEGDVKKIAPSIEMIRCGGHFPGSCVLHWKRSSNGLSGSDTGVVLCSDTIGIAPDMNTVTFLWSYPNMLPLPPKDVVKIIEAIRPYEFEHMLCGWPGRELHGGAKLRVVEGAKRFVRCEGWDDTEFDLR